MKWYIYLIIVLTILVLIKIITRKKLSNLDSSLENRARSRLRSIGDCCRKVGKFFGGGA